MKKLIVVVALLSFGCLTRVKDTRTVTNTEATHVWFVQANADGNDVVLYCDSHWQGTNQVGCVKPGGQ